MFIARNTI